MLTMTAAWNNFCYSVVDIG